MKRLCLVAMLLFAVVAGIAGQKSGKLVILHTNDLHSKLRGFSPESEYSPLETGDDATVGGFSRIATLIKNEMEQAGDDLLVLDAGDFLMGTLFHHLEPVDGFQLRLMKQMGYDVVSIGNHEFDAGPEVFAEIVAAALARGEIPPLVISNMVFSPKDQGDDSLESLFNAGAIRREIIIDKEGTDLKVGIFALMGVDAADVAPAAAPVTFSKQVKSARKSVKSLKKQECDLIICLSHSGLTVNDDGTITGEDYKLANKVKGINLIISAHTHTTLTEPLRVKDAVIVQTGAYGENVGKVTLSIDEGMVAFEKYELLPVNDNIAGDAEIEAMIEERIDTVNQQVLSSLGLRYDSFIVESDFALVCDEYGDLQASNLGPLVADAIHDYVNLNSSSGSDISIVAAGVIREKITRGEQWVADIFRVMSLGTGKDELPGYPLARVYVTGRELKNILEILLVAWKSSPSNFIYYSGLNVSYNPDKGLLRKVVAVEIVKGDGSVAPVDISKNGTDLYSITANSYILEFIGIIKSMSFGLINVVPKDATGTPIEDFGKAVINFSADGGTYTEGKEWIALIEYLSKMPDLNGNGIPDMDPAYREPARNIIPVGGK
jgi:5'-nucleotidase / UDP-sugar diphosphatase